MNQSACVIHGWQAGLFVMRPTPSRMNSLLNRMHAGNFSLFTNGEQDILDSEFDTTEHCARTSSTNCLSHAYFGSSAHPIVFHHKMHGDLPDFNFRGRVDMWWQDQVLHNLTCILCNTTSVTIPLLPEQAEHRTCPPTETGSRRLITGSFAQRRLLMPMALLERSTIHQRWQPISEIKSSTEYPANLTEDYSLLKTEINTELGDLF